MSVSENINLVEEILVLSWRHAEGSQFLLSWRHAEGSQFPTFFLSLKRKTLNQLSWNNPCKVSYFLRCLSITCIKKENLLFQSYTTLNRIYILKWHDNGIINLDGLIILWMFRISAKLHMNIWVTCIARA